MFLHVGQDVMVVKQDVIAILNKNLLDVSEEMRYIYQKQVQDGTVLGNLAEAKTLVLTNQGIILSNISTQTLLRRAAWLDNAGDD
ncbi:MAG: DUF370 domain-containing protein [Firmicutes bacterium]|nr:DUF370 domain-containing protein [Bacillota bacterium]